MAVKFTNNAATTLTSAVSISDTTIAVASNTGFPSISGSDYFYVSIDSEVLKVTSVSGTTFTVDAATAAHDNGNTVELRVSAEVLNDVRTETTNRSISDSTSTTSSTTSASSTAVKDALASAQTYADSVGIDFTSSTSAPSSPTDGDHWFDSTNGILYVRADSNWIDVSTAGGGDANVQADWTQSTTTHDAYIQNKPTLSGTNTGDNATNTQYSGLVSNIAHPLVETAVPTGALFTDTNTTYSAGTGMSLSGTQFNCTVTDTNTTYSAGTGMSLSGTQFNCTVTDTNTTYSGGTGLTLSGTTFNLDGATQTARGGAKMHVSGGILYIVTT